MPTKLNRVHCSLAGKLHPLKTYLKNGQMLLRLGKIVLVNRQAVLKPDL